MYLSLVITFSLTLLNPLNSVLLCIPLWHFVFASLCCLLFFFFLPFMSLVDMSHIMRKRCFCMCENKGAGQLCSYCTMISTYVFTT